MKKKLFALFLSVVIGITSLHPVSVLADEDTVTVATEGVVQDETEKIEEGSDDEGQTEVSDTNTFEGSASEQTTENEADGVISEVGKESGVLTAQDANTEKAVEDRKAGFVTFPMFTDATGGDDSSYERLEMEEGIYMILIQDAGLALSVQDASKEDGAPLILDSYTYKLSQQFTISEAEDGWYRIINCYSGSAMSIKNNSSASRAGVEFRTYEGDDGQLWQFLKSEDEDDCCYVKSKIGAVLNCMPGYMEAGGEVQTHELNGLPLQRWKVVEANDLTAAFIEDGEFQLTDAATCEKAITPYAYSKNEAAEMVLNTTLGHKGGQYQVEAVGNGWYSIKNIHTGYALTASGGAENASVIQTKWVGDDEQLWRFVYTGNWSFYIQSMAGTFLTRQDGSTADGTKITLTTIRNAKDQMWVMKPVKEQTDAAVQDGAEYLIVSSLDLNRVVEVSHASVVPGGNIQVSRESLSAAQRFRAEKVEEGWYKLVSVNSGLVVEVAGASIADGANIHQNDWLGLDSQLWRFVDAGNGYTYIQSMLGTVLACAANPVTDGTNIQSSLPEKNEQQKFIMCNTSTENYIHVTTLSEYTARITLYNPSGTGIEKVQFPTWSMINGQDDIIWLDGVKVDQNIWAVELDSKDFDGDNWFDITTHIYVTDSTGTRYVGYRDYALKAHLEGWIYVDGLRRYRTDDGTIMNDVSEIFNPGSKYITVDRIKGITTIYGYNSETRSYDTPIKAMWCSVGNPISLTRAGTYSMGWQLKKKEMNASDGSYRCWAPYVSQIYGTVYFHGVASNTPDLQSVSAAAFRMLGNPASHGCIRLAAIDARWIYYNTSSGTTIKVGDNLAAPMVPVRYQWVGGDLGSDPTYIP